MAQDKETKAGKAKSRANAKADTAATPETTGKEETGKSAKKPAARGGRKKAQPAKAASDAPKPAAKTARKSTRKKIAAKKPAAPAEASPPEAAAKESESKAGAPVGAESGAETTPGTRSAAAPKPAVRFEEAGGLGFLIFDTPGKPVNILSGKTMQELEAVLDEVAEKTALQAVLFMSGKPGNFIAGADINAIKEMTEPAAGEQAAHEGHRVFGKIAALPMTTIAVIDGVCFGGGLELSLACDFRIARGSAKTKIGLPEVRIGIIPGWGGTQRLPRLIGIQKALDYIVSSRMADARRAYRDGLVDRIIPDEYPPEYTRTAAVQFARELAAPAARERVKKRRGKSTLQAVLLEKNPLGRKILFDQARKRARKATSGHYPAPLKAIEAVEKGISAPLKEGLAVEARLLGECIVTEVCKNLIRVFQLSEEAKKDPGVSGFAGEIQRFQRIGVLGAGVMGGGIAQLAAYYDLPVRMKDINYAAIGAGMKQASKVFREAARRRRLKPSQASRKLGLISGATDYSGFNQVDLAIEAIVEDLEIKKKVFAETDKVLPAHAVLASNTSSLPVTEMAKATKRPERVAGLHFFNPVHKMPLVEVIRGAQSSDATIASLVAFSRSIGKTPVVVKDSPGFLVNRILSPYMNEAAVLLEEGQQIEKIDRAVTAFGMPMGPLTLFDEVGIDVAHKVAKILQKAFGDAMQASPVIGKLVENKRFGKKNGKGFYIHKGKSKQPDPNVYTLLGDLRSVHPSLPAQEIQDRCIFLMINEAARCLMDDIVRHPRDVDIGMIFGTGFPPFRGGLLHYADTLGSAAVKDRLEALAEKYGPRFAPAQLIVDLAKTGKTFFA